MNKGDVVTILGADGLRGTILDFPGEDLAEVYVHGQYVIEISVCALQKVPNEQKWEKVHENCYCRKGMS